MRHVTQRPETPDDVEDGGNDETGEDKKEYVIKELLLPRDVGFFARFPLWLIMQLDTSVYRRGAGTGLD